MEDCSSLPGFLLASQFARDRCYGTVGDAEPENICIEIAVLQRTDYGMDAAGQCFSFTSRCGGIAADNFRYLIPASVQRHS